MIGPKPPQIGGIESVMDDLLRSDLDQRCELFHLDISKPKSRGFKQFDSVTGYARSFKRPFIVSFYSFGYSVKYFFKILWRLASKGDQIVHLHSSAYMSFWEKCLFLDLAKLFGKKVVVHMHGSSFDSFVDNSRGLQRRALLYHLRRFDCVIALSQFWQDYFRKYVPAERIVQIENRIRVQDYQLPGAVKTPFPSMVFLGEVCQRKGIYDLLETLPKLLIDFPDLHFYIVGPGEQEQVRQILINSGLQAHATLPGPQFGREKLPWLHQAWCFTLPSYAEVFPVSIVEAMACGLPVVASFTGGIPDIVQDGVNGFLAPAGDIQGLQQALTAVLANPQKAAAMGRANLVKANEQYDISLSIRDLVRLYENLQSRIDR